MKFKHVFKHIDHSETLLAHAKERFDRIEKQLFKVDQTLVTFSKVRHEFRADVVMKTKDGIFKASGLAESLYAAVDDCVRRLTQQYTKKRKKVKNHKRHYLSQRPEGEEAEVSGEFWDKKAA